MRISDAQKIVIPRSIAAPREDVDIDRTATIFSQWLINKGVDLDDTLLMVDGMVHHIEHCREGGGDRNNMGMQGYRGILTDVRTITRNTSDGKPWAVKGCIVSTFDENSEDEEIYTGILDLCGRTYVHDEQMFNIALSNTVFTTAKRLIGKPFVGNKLFSSAPVTIKGGGRKQNGTVRSLIFCAPNWREMTEDERREVSGGTTSHTTHHKDTQNAPEDAKDTTQPVDRTVPGWFLSDADYTSLCREYGKGETDFVELCDYTDQFTFSNGEVQVPESVEETTRRIIISVVTDKDNENLSDADLLRLAVKSAILV